MDVVIILFSLCSFFDFFFFRDAVESADSDTEKDDETTRTINPDTNHNHRLPLSVEFGGGGGGGPDACPLRPAEDCAKDSSCTVNETDWLTSRTGSVQIIPYDMCRITVRVQDCSDFAYDKMRARKKKNNRTAFPLARDYKGKLNLKPRCFAKITGRSAPLRHPSNRAHTYHR